jgi:hypothetical protein
VPVGHRDLDRIFSIQHERTVNNDNTVRLANIVLQIEPTTWRSTLAGCRVIVQERLDGTLVISFGPHQLGHDTPDGQPIAELARAPNARRPKKSRGIKDAASRAAFLNEFLRYGKSIQNEGVDDPVDALGSSFG